MRVDASMLSNASNIYHGDLIRCPHHVPLPDNEWIADRDRQIRNQYQVNVCFRGGILRRPHTKSVFLFEQTEITRTYIKPPPNKTALDVPEHAYSVYPPASSCNLNQRTVPTTKSSKSNSITKVLLRVFSAKSPETTTRTSSSATSPAPQNHHHHHYNAVVSSAASSTAMSSTNSIQKSAAYSSASAVSNHNTSASNTTLPAMLVSSSTSSASSALSSSSTESSTTTTKLPPSPSPEAGAHI